MAIIAKNCIIGDSFDSLARWKCNAQLPQHTGQKLPWPMFTMDHARCVNNAKNSSPSVRKQAEITSLCVTQRTVNAEIGYERSDTRQDIGIPRRCDAAPVLIVTNAAQIKECRDKDLNWKFWWRLTITTWSSLLYDMFDTIDFKLVYEKTYIRIHNIHYITLEFLTIICRSVNKC